MALAKISAQERSEALVLLQDFRDLQEERIRQFNYLNTSHKTYLETGKQTGCQDYDLDNYKLCVKESTDKFKSISAKIMAINDKLAVFSRQNGNDNGPPMTFIKQIQESEEQKLRITVDLQLAKQQEQEAPKDEEELNKKNVNGLVKMLNQVTENIRDSMEEIRYFVEEVKSVDEEECDSR